MIATMTVRNDHRGVTARRKILAELRRGELARERPPSILALADACGMAYTPTRNQLVHLADAGLILWAPTRGRRSAGAVLTQSGRAAADLLIGA